MISRATHPKQLSTWDSDSHPPLAVFCPSSVGSRRLTADGRSAGDYELLRRIHAVCDAFKNIAHVAFGQSYNDRIPSLAVACALVIGENMPTATSGDVSGEDSADENDILDVDHIYEVVPPHHRRFLIVSHALSMILCLFPRHHALLTMLLDHCLSFGLVHESIRLLNLILAQAFRPLDLSCPPPVTHPAHTSYLIDLHAKWTTGKDPSGTSLDSNSLLFTTSAFCQALLASLSQPPPNRSCTLWTSEALDGLLNVVINRDIDSYSLIVCALSRNFWAILGSSPDTIRNDTQLHMLRNKLSGLMSNLFDLLFLDDGPPTPPSTVLRVHAVLDLLSDCHAARLHCIRSSTPGSVDLQDMIITFTAYILATFQSSISRPGHLLDILGASDPTPTTFSKLMAHFSRLQETHSFEDFMEAFLSELKIYSSIFLSHRFFHLDASLWACALHHFQATICSSRNASSTLVVIYKRHLIEAVEAAECRCFGEKLDSDRITTPDRQGPARRTPRGRPSGHWVWEDMIGAWIRKTPMHKKLRIDNRPFISSQHNHSRPSHTPSALYAPTAISTLSNTLRHSSPSSPSTFCSQLSEIGFASDSESEYQDEVAKENNPRNFPAVVRQRRPIERRSSNFSSLLADAQSNRIVLHSKPRPRPKPPSSRRRVLPCSSQESRHASGNQKQPARHKQMMVPPVLLEPLLPSDDSLNLFAYVTSSPLRC